MALVALLVIAAAFCGLAADEPAPNFGVVVENGIYRGGQPDAADLARLRELGVRTVLKLNTHELDEEATACRRLGMTLIHVPTKASTIAKRESCADAARALEVLSNRENWPVFVHCEHGRDRTGYLVGLYRTKVQGWTWEQVDGELRAYGHEESARVAFPSISRDLERGGVSCGP